MVFYINIVYENNNNIHTTFFIYAKEIILYIKYIRYFIDNNYAPWKRFLYIQYVEIHSENMLHQIQSIV